MNAHTHKYRYTNHIHLIYTTNIQRYTTYTHISMQIYIYTLKYMHIPHIETFTSYRILHTQTHTHTTQTQMQYIHSIHMYNTHIYTFKC